MELISKPHPFTHHQKFVGEIPDGSSIAQIVDSIDCDPILKDHFVVQINGRIVAKKAWHYTFPKKESAVTITAIPQGGDGNKGIMASIAMIALMFAAPQLAGFLRLEVLGLGIKAQAAVQFGVTLIGALLIGALFKPPTPKELGGEGFTFSGQSNAIRKNQGVMSIYGTNKVYPDVIATPYTIASGGYDDLYAVYGFGYGRVQIDDLRIGNTPIENFQKVETRIVQNWTSKDGLQLYPNDVDVQDFSVVLEQDYEGNVFDPDCIDDDEWFTMETADDCDWCCLEIAFPSGLIEEEANKDNPHASDVKFSLQYRLWTPGDTESWSGFIGLDHSYSEEWKNGLGVRDFNPSLGEYYFARLSTSTWFSSTFNRYWRDPDTWNLYYYYTNSWKRGATTLPIKTSEAITAGDKTTIDGRVYTFLNDHPAGTIVEAPITPALQDTVEIGEYRVCTNPVPCSDPPLFTPRQVTITSAGSQWFQVNKKTVVPFTIGVNVHFTTRGRYELRIARHTPYWEGHRYISDTTAVRLLKSITVESPIDTGFPMTIMELKIRASKQLNGTLDDLNAICSRFLPVYRDGVWSEEITSTPAWVYYDILTGVANKKPVSEERVNVPKLVEWANYTDQTRETNSQYHTFDDEFFSYQVDNPDGTTSYWLNAGEIGVPVIVSSRIDPEDSIYLGGKKYTVIANNTTGDSYPYAGYAEVRFVPSLQTDIELGREENGVFVGNEVYTVNEEPYLACNFVFNSNQTTVFQMLQQVASSGQAAYSMQDNKHSVVFDQQQSVPVQVFTQRNSWGFRMKRHFIDQPHGLQVNFKDKTNDWENGEIIAYMDGYDKYEVEEFNPQPGFDADWIAQTGWTIVDSTTDPSGFGYASVDTNPSSNVAYIDLVAPLSFKSGIRYLVKCEVFDYITGRVRIVILGRNYTSWYEADGSYEEYVAAAGSTDRIYIQAEGGSELKVRQVSVSVLGASLIEELQLPMNTSPSQAWRQGRVALAQGILRPEEYSFYTDVENLVVERGDRALIAHDVPSAGGTVSRIVSIVAEGADTLIIGTDEAFYFEAGKEYTVAIRTETPGEIYTTTASEFTGDATKLVIASTGVYDISVGQLLVFGETNRITTDFLVAEIRPAENLSAQLTCVPYAPEIYDADTGVIPVYMPLITKRRDQLPTPVSNLYGSFSITESGVDYIVDFMLSWEVTNDSNLEEFQVWWISNETGQWEQLASTRETSIKVRPVTNQYDLQTDIFEQSTLFAIVAVNYNKHGLPPSSSPSISIFVPDPKAARIPPPDVTGFTLDSNVDGLSLSWDLIDDPRISGYELRYQPDFYYVPGEDPADYNSLIERTRDRFCEDSSIWVISDPTNIKVYNNSIIVTGSQTVTETIEYATSSDCSPFSTVTSDYLVRFTVQNREAGSVRVNGGTWRTANGTYNEVFSPGIGYEMSIEVDSSFKGSITDIRLFQVTPSPDIEIAWEYSNRIATVSKNTTGITVPMRVGYYMIKAVNILNIPSVNEAIKHTTTQLIYQDTKLIKHFQGFPWACDKDNVEFVLNTTCQHLVLMNRVVDGVYTFGQGGNSVFEFDDAFEFDITQQVVLGHNFPHIPYGDNFLTLPQYEYKDGQVSIEVSYTSDEETLSDWTSLSSVAHIGGDSIRGWSDWLPITRAKIIGKFFRFRARLAKDTSPQNLLQDSDFSFPIVISVSDIHGEWLASDINAFEKTIAGLKVNTIGFTGGENLSIHLSSANGGYPNLDRMHNTTSAYTITYTLHIEFLSFISGSFTVKINREEYTSGTPYIFTSEAITPSKQVNGKVIVDFTVDLPATTYGTYLDTLELDFDEGSAATIKRLYLFDPEPNYAPLTLYDANINMRLAKRTVTASDVFVPNAYATTKVYFKNAFYEPPSVVVQAKYPPKFAEVFSIARDHFVVTVFTDSSCSLTTSDYITYTATGYGKAVDLSEVN